MLPLEISHKPSGQEQRLELEAARTVSLTGGTLNDREQADLELPELQLRVRQSTERQELYKIQVRQLQWQHQMHTARGGLGDDKKKEEKEALVRWQKEQFTSLSVEHEAERTNKWTGLLPAANGGAEKILHAARDRELALQKVAEVLIAQAQAKSRRQGGRHVSTSSHTAQPTAGTGHSSGNRGIQIGQAVRGSSLDHVGQSRQHPPSARVTQEQWQEQRPGEAAACVADSMVVPPSHSPGDRAVTGGGTAPSRAAGGQEAEAISILACRGNEGLQLRAAEAEAVEEMLPGTRRLLEPPPSSAPCGADVLTHHRHNDHLQPVSQPSGTPSQHASTGSSLGMPRVQEDVVRPSSTSGPAAGGPLQFRSRWEHVQLAQIAQLVKEGKAKPDEVIRIEGLRLADDGRRSQKAFEMQVCFSILLNLSEQTASIQT